jgi:hypothetical protein
MNLFLILILIAKKDPGRRMSANGVGRQRRI